MPRPLRPFTFKPSEGGRLITSLSVENVGEANYRVKKNWRRVAADAEGLREGDLAFPTDLTVTSKLQLLAEVTRPNGVHNIVAASATTLYRYNGTTWDTIGTGFNSAGVWDWADLNGYLILNNTIDLPVTFRQEESVVKPMYELREMGVARVGVMSVYSGILKFYDVTEIQGDQMATWMNGLTPYGFVPDDICNRIRYLTVNSEVGEPRHWAPKVPATMSGTGHAAVLAYPLHTETLGVGTKIAIINAGPAGGTLGGQEGVEDGCPVTSLSGLNIQWSGQDSDSELTYPRTVQIMRFTDISTIVSRQDLQDDSSGVLAARQLGDYEAVYRETGIFLCRFTGNKAAPFIYKKAYSGPNNLAPRFRRCIATAEGGVHVFVGENSIFMFDGSGAPQIIKAVDEAKEVFFATADATSFARHNPISNEIWFVTPTTILAYDYKFNSASELDVPYTAAAYVHQPGIAGDAPRWFIMAVLSSTGHWTVVQYGALNSGPLTFLRRGVAYVCRILSGLWSLGDPFNLKDVRTYLPQLIGRGATPVQIKLYATNDPDTAPTLEVDTTLGEEPDVTLLVRNLFFQDEIVITSPAGTTSIHLTARTFEVAIGRTRGVGRVDEP